MDETFITLRIGETKSVSIVEAGPAGYLWSFREDFDSSIVSLAVLEDDTKTNDSIGGFQSLVIHLRGVATGLKVYYHRRPWDEEDINGTLNIQVEGEETTPLVRPSCSG